MKKKIKNNFEKEKYMTYADGKNRRHILSMPTTYLRQRLFSLSRRFPMLTAAIGVAYADGFWPST
jgi:hypothetical protein